MNGEDSAERAMAKFVMLETICALLVGKAFNTRASIDLFFRSLRESGQPDPDAVLDDVTDAIYNKLSDEIASWEQNVRTMFNA